MRAEIYTGLVKRPNEKHLHGINGAKLAVGPAYGGFQHTGHDTNLYIGYVFEFGSVSLWGADGRPMGILLSLFR